MKFLPLQFYTLAALFFAPLCRAQAPSLSGTIIDPSAFGVAIPANVTHAVISTVGAISMHRPYTGATSIGKINSVDVLIEATLIKIADEIPNALKANGLDSSGSENVPSLPFAALQVRKGLGPAFDIGGSIIRYQKNFAWGLDAKWTFYDPEEGLTHALFLGYTQARLPMAYTELKTWNLEWIFSRKLNFAEPYIGIGARYSYGTLSLTVYPDPPLPQIPIQLSSSSQAASFYGRLGVFFRVLGPQGLRMGIEGSFDIHYMHSLGAVIGMGF